MTDTRRSFAMSLILVLINVTQYTKRFAQCYRVTLSNLPVSEAGIKALAIYAARRSPSTFFEVVDVANHRHNSCTGLLQFSSESLPQLCVRSRFNIVDIGNFTDYRLTPWSVTSASSSHSREQPMHCVPGAKIPLDSNRF